MFGCLRRAVVLVIVLVLLAGAFLFRDQLRTAWNEFRGVEVEEGAPSEALAAGAEDKLFALRDGEESQVSLSAVELESLLVYRYPGVIPAFLDSPTVELAEDQLRLRARVPVDQLPTGQGLGDLGAFLPDTAEVLVAGKLIPLDSGRVAFSVDEVNAARMPVPMRLVPAALNRIGRRDEPGLPADAMALPLPAGIGAAYVRRDSLILLARPGRVN